MGRLSRGIAAGLLCCSLASISSAQSYDLTDIGTGIAYGLNDNGDVVGFSDSIGGAFLWSGGAVNDLGLRGTLSIAYGINNNRQVVGYTLVPQYHAFLWSGGSISDLGPQPTSTARAINASGQVVGSTPAPGGNAALWIGGSLTNLGTLGGQAAEAYGMNNNGQVIGGAQVSGGAYHAFRWSAAPMSDLGTLGGTRSRAFGVNDIGQVVGDAYTSGDASNHAVLWSGASKIDLNMPGRLNSEAEDINNKGQIVGTSDDLAFFHSGGITHDLNTMIPAGSGWTLKNANAINEAGQIVGEGTYNGQRHAFLLTPTAAPPPPPKMYAILMGANDRGVRGDLDAQAIRSALLRFPGTKAENFTLASTKQQFESAMAAVTSAIQEQDSLTIFYSGHGAYDQSFLAKPEPLVRNGILARRAMGGDEFNNSDDLWDVPDGLLADDELTAMLSSVPKLAHVKKTVILDSCFSGGFWGQPGNEADEGDLDKLQNIGLIASASEGDLSFSIPGASLNIPGAGRGFFSIALEGVLNDLADGGSGLSFSTAALGLATGYTNSNFPSSGAIRGFPWLDNETIVPVDEALLSFSAVSADYDQNGSLLPEPSSAVFLIAGIALPLRRARRRTRNGTQRGTRKWDAEAKRTRAFIRSSP